MIKKIGAMSGTLTILILLIVGASFLSIQTTITGKLGTSIDFCQDSDSGKTYTELGRVYGKQNTIASLFPESYEYHDSCIDEYTVIEYYCEQNGFNERPSFEEHRCETVCRNGKCLDDIIESPQRVSLYKRILTLFS